MSREDLEKHDKRMDNICCNCREILLQNESGFCSNCECKLTFNEKTRIISDKFKDTITGIGNFL